MNEKKIEENSKPNHSSFKMTEKNVSCLFSSRNGLTLLLIVFVVIVLCMAILTQLDRKNKDIQQPVLEKDNEKITQELEQYPNLVKDIIIAHQSNQKSNNYLKTTTCQNYVDDALDKVLDLRVPNEYKEFHLKLVILLDKERTLCGQTDLNLNLEWEEFLSAYPGLQ